MLIVLLSPLAGELALSFILDSSVGKESDCNAGDPSSIPGSGSSTGEGVGYPLQYSWFSLVAPLVKNPPTMQETWVQSLGWEDTHGIVDYTVHGIAKSRTQLSDFCFHYHSLKVFSKLCVEF